MFPLDGKYVENISNECQQRYFNLIPQFRMEAILLQIPLILIHFD